MILNKETRNRLLLLLVGLNIPIIYCSAGQMSSLFDRNQYTPLATVTIGPDFISPGQSQTLTLLPPFQNTYTNGSSSQTNADAGALVGVERPLTEQLSLQLGVAGYVASQITPKGDVWQFATPVFDDLSYSYHIHHARVMATSKLLTTISKYPALHPYISGEIGAAFNHASGYQEMPLVAGAVATAPFSNHNQTSFTWGVGVGADYTINPHVRLGAGYQFSDLGGASLGPTTAALTLQTLSLSHIYANQLRFQLTILV
jgi:opacity protein-like surface antigen